MDPMHFFAQRGLIQSPYAGPIFLILSVALIGLGALGVTFAAWLGVRAPAKRVDRHALAGLSWADAVLAGADASVLATLTWALSWCLSDTFREWTAQAPLYTANTLLAGWWFGLLALRSLEPPTPVRTLAFL